MAMKKGRNGKMNPIRYEDYKKAKHFKGECMIRHEHREMTKNVEPNQERTTNPILALTTSNGLLPSVEKQPALIPPNNPIIGVNVISPSFVTRLLYSLNHMKRKPEFDPCFIAVAIA